MVRGVGRDLSGRHAQFSPEAGCPVRQPGGLYTMPKALRPCSMLLLEGMLPDTVSSFLDSMIRIRAVQNFTPAQARRVHLPAQEYRARCAGNRDAAGPEALRGTGGTWNLPSTILLFLPSISTCTVAKEFTTSRPKKPGERPSGCSSRPKLSPSFRSSFIVLCRRTRLT